MDIAKLIDALSEPTAFCPAVGSVVVCQTHISVVFLVDEFAYKIKKPVDMGFLDFSTLERRRHFCEEEVRLNRRLAPSVYLGVVPIVRRGDSLHVDPADRTGHVVEWAVKMRRLSDEATLRWRLLHGQVDAERMRAFGRKVAEFHAAAESGPAISEAGRFATVAGNCRENFEQSAGHVGRTVDAAVFERIRRLTEESLDRLRPIIEARAARGVPRDTHGDLRLDHIYAFPGRSPPDDLVVIDCIEFNERFRHADPVADMAFVVMDLTFHGRRDLARVFADAYFEASGDAEGRELLPLYVTYRAVVRAKVEGFELGEREIPAEEKDAAIGRAHAHSLVALGALERPERRPCLVMTSGLPGSGKSTLARGLAERGGFEVIRTDVVRKELAGQSAEREEIYKSDWSDRTYRECLRRAEEILFRGRRVIVDANFRRDAMRRLFVDSARRWGVPCVLFHCRTTPDVARRRLETRRGDASDADWEIRQQLADEWEEFGTDVRPAVHAIDTIGTQQEAVAAAIEVLREVGLV
jgi:aminoglycoside phosphotransferase family enzyme/predicted kinase